MILLIDLGYKYGSQLEKLVDESMDVKKIALADFNEQSLSPEILGIIISPAHISLGLSSISLYLNQLKPLKSGNIPALGLGIGHQLLGLLFGAHPAEFPYTSDVTIISILSDSPIFDKLPAEIEMLKEHAGTISIPPGFTLIASSDNCINEGMRHATLPLFGLQFSPDRSGIQGAIIIENFCRFAQQYKKEIELK